MVMIVTVVTICSKGDRDDAAPTATGHVAPGTAPSGSDAHRNRRIHHATLPSTVERRADLRAVAPTAHTGNVSVLRRRGAPVYRPSIGEAKNGEVERGNRTVDGRRIELG